MGKSSKCYSAWKWCVVPSTSDRCWVAPKCEFHVLDVSSHPFIIKSLLIIIYHRKMQETNSITFTSRLEMNGFPPLLSEEDIELSKCFFTKRTKAGHRKDGDHLLEGEKMGVQKFTGRNSILQATSHREHIISKSGLSHVERGRHRQHRRPGQNLDAKVVTIPSE